MRDKSLGVFLTVLFGISGMAVLLLVWLLPTLESERTMAIFVGSAGLLVARIGKNHGYLRRLSRAIGGVNTSADAQALIGQDR